MLYNNANDNNQYLTRILHDYLVFILKKPQRIEKLVCMLENRHCLAHLTSGAPNKP